MDSVNTGCIMVTCPSCYENTIISNNPVHYARQEDGSYIGWFHCVKCGKKIEYIASAAICDVVSAIPVYEIPASKPLACKECEEPLYCNQHATPCNAGE